MGRVKLISIVLCMSSVVVSSKIISLDENWVCFVKKSCQECLKIPACSWCSAKQKCFSESVPSLGERCSNETTRATDFGFSLEHNADCACAEGEMENHCRHPEESDAVQCSGRGACICGRCVCDAPDTDHPTKMVMGEYCEFDNFSCQGSKCNEGPYSLTQIKSLDDDSPPKLAEEDQPVET